VYNIEFVWDRQKAEINQRKHKISFEEARTVFYDDFAQLMSDPDHSTEEDRFIILGRSSQMRILVVCHCYRENDSIIRIISARKATKRELRSYPG
jgi:uncharacterized protein